MEGKIKIRDEGGTVTAQGSLICKREDHTYTLTKTSHFLGLKQLHGTVLNMAHTFGDTLF